MIKTLPCFCALALVFAVSANSKADDLSCYELRTYHASEGKLEELNNRFKNHTMSLFEKHGMTNVFYLVPLENMDNTLVYLLAYPDKAAREASWKAFLSDPEWIAAKEASEVNGKLVKKVESLFLERTDFSPTLPLESAETPRLFEMRRYTTAPDKLAALDARFRDFTVRLFEKHGMKNLPYFHLASGQEGSENTLLYFLAHDSIDAKNASFKAFGSDPEWQTARDDSEKQGKLLVEKGVASTLLIPTAYSPVQ